MAVKYIPFSPNVLQGQAVLDNFVRTQRILRYKGDSEVEASIRRGMPLYEVSEKEARGDHAADNLLIRGECVSACAYLKDKGITVDLVYIDPPFASGADYAKKVYVRRNPKVAAAIKQAEEELEIDEMKTFEEKMYGDIWNKEDYLNWMYTNLVAIKSIMSEKASIYVHLDDHIGHYVKILMDEVFGESNFKNDIGWKSTASHNDSDKSFSAITDHIYFYTLSEDSVFNRLYTPYTEEYIESEFTKLPSGRYYKAENMLDPQQKMDAYDFHGTTARWRTTPDKFEELWNAPQTEVPNSHGRIKLGRNGKPIKRCRIVFMDELPGVPVNDIWDNISYVAGRSEEKEDYATQKPIELLERIIKASSNEGMLVADFFGGSGVTAKAAHKLGRRFIHADIGINSIQVTRDKLVEMRAGFTSLEINDGINLFRNPQQTNDKLLELTGVTRYAQLDCFWAGITNDSAMGMVPVYLPDFLPGKHPMLDEAFLSQLVHGKLGALPDGTKKVIVYYVDSIPKEKREAFMREQNLHFNIEVEFLDLKPKLDLVVVSDEADYTLQEVQPEGQMFSVWQLTINSFMSDRVLQKINAVNETRYAQYLKKLKDYRDHIEDNQKKGKKEPTFTRIDISDEGLETIEWLSLDCEEADINAPWHSNVEVKIDKSGNVIRNGKKTNTLWDGTIQTDDNSQKPLRLKIRNICGDETEFQLW